MDVVPTPLNVTSCRPVESSPLITQRPLAAPPTVGVNVTFSVSVSPGPIVVPSGRVVVAANSPPLGGLDFVIETFVPPMLLIVKDLVAVLPTATSPNSFFSLVTFRTPGGPALPDTGTLPLPPVVSKPTSSWKLPSAVG